MVPGVLSSLPELPDRGEKHARLPERSLSPSIRSAASRRNDLERTGVEEANETTQVRTDLEQVV
jgi:hypothetical protein